MGKNRPPKQDYLFGDQWLAEVLKKTPDEKIIPLCGTTQKLTVDPTVPPNVVLVRDAVDDMIKTFGPF